MQTTCTKGLVLRPYQTRTLTSLFDYLSEHTGNPCVVLPTGAGKSIIIAAFCKQALEWFPETRILILTHQKELIEQDADKLLKIWPDAIRYVGIYSASLRSKCLDAPITFASIQSIGKKSMPEVNLVLVDEAHLINNDVRGLYRTFLSHLSARVIGLTATPYRLGQGSLTEGEDALFTDIIQPVGILELQQDGYLARLRSKHTFNTLDVSGVHTRGGEYIERELQQAVNTFSTNKAVAEEILHYAEKYDRHHWLIFCAGVDHAREVSNIINAYGVPCGCVTGSMSMTDREEVLGAFTSGTLTAMTNANVLTTGFDYPDIDLIAMLRPTKSPGLYMQMVGRGLRLKSNGGDCLVLDFAGNVAEHGPIAFIQPPSARKGKGNGVAPCKECPQCMEILHASVMKCPACGYEFPKQDRTWMLFDGDINGDGYSRYTPNWWYWDKVESRTSGKPMIVCTYTVQERQYATFKKFYCVWHEGRVHNMAIHELAKLCTKVGIEWTDDYDDLLEKLREAPHPSLIFTKKEGKYDRIAEQLWDDDIAELEAQQREKEKILNEARQNIYSGASDPRDL